MGRRNVLPEARSFTMAPSPFSCRSKSSTSFHIDGDRKSTRLNSSHSQISYAVFCLKKKKKIAYCGYTHSTHTFCRKLYHYLRRRQVASCSLIFHIFFSCHSFALWLRMRHGS